MSFLQVILLLSSLLGPVKDINSPLKITGEFPLAKRLSTDRVSGSIAASMTLHFPVSHAGGPDLQRQRLSPQLLSRIHGDLNNLSAISQSHDMTLSREYSRKPPIITSHNSVNGSGEFKTPPLNRYRSRTPDSGAASVSSIKSGSKPGSSSSSYSHPIEDLVSESSSIQHFISPYRSSDISTSNSPSLAESLTPVLSSKLSARIGQRRQILRQENCSNKLMYSNLLPVDQNQSPDLNIESELEASKMVLPSDSSLCLPRYKPSPEFKISPQNRNSDIAIQNSRLANVTKRLQGLEIELLASADAALENIFRKIELTEMQIKEKQESSFSSNNNRSASEIKIGITENSSPCLDNAVSPDIICEELMESPVLVDQNDQLSTAQYSNLLIDYPFEVDENMTICAELQELDMGEEDEYIIISNVETARNEPVVIGATNQQQHNDGTLALRQQSSQQTVYIDNRDAMCNAETVVINDNGMNRSSISRTIIIDHSFPKNLEVSCDTSVAVVKDVNSAASTVVGSDEINEVSGDQYSTEYDFINGVWIFK